MAGLGKEARVVRRFLEGPYGRDLRHWSPGDEHGPWTTAGKTGNLNLIAVGQ